MIGCKRALVLFLLGIGARPGAAADGMRVLTFVPGVAHGALPVALDLGSSPPPADLFANGRAACRVTAVRQTCIVDLGPAPRVTLLELVRRDASGRVVERARRWVNKPSAARSEVLVRSDCARASGPCTLRFSWSHDNAIAPRELTVAIDGERVYRGEPRDVPVPFAKGKAARVVSAELVFKDDERATQTLLIGSGVSSAVEAPLNAVPVQPEGPGGRDPALLRTLGGRVVHAVEPGEREVLFVVAPSAVSKLQALTAAAQKPLSRNAGLMGKLVPAMDHIVYFSPLARRGTFSTATRASEKMYRLQGFECAPRSAQHEHTLALPCVDPELLAGEKYRFAATVASAAFTRAAVPRRRVAVLVLGDEERARDESPYGAAEARRYLADILVPLEVWRLGSAAGGGWPAGRRISNADDLVGAWEALLTGLDAQRICWIAEDLDPSAFRLEPEDAGLVLAGRRPAGSAPDAEIASSEPAAFSGAPDAASATNAGRARGRVAAAQEVSLVNLDASVTDRSGKPVHGLSASDFELLVRGRAVAITNFSEIGTEAPADSGSGAAPAPPRQKKRIALFVDRLSLGDARRSKRFFQALDDFVARTIGPGDEVSVLAYDTSLAVRVPFTGDAGAVHRALEVLAKESARPPSTFTGTESVERLVDEIAQAEAEIAAREGRRNAVVPTPRPGAQTPDPPNPTVVAEARTLATQEWLRTRRKVSAIRSVLAELGGMDGKRVLVLASHRLSRNPGLEYFLSKRLDREVVVTRDALEFDAKGLLESLAQAANGYGVTLHGLYPEAGGDFDPSVVERSIPSFQGQVAGRRGMEIDANEGAGLHLAVDDTGGLVGLGAEAAPDVLSRMAQDLESYYSFGFPAPGAGPESRIELRPRRAGLVVRTRKAIVERTGAERMTDRVVSNLFRDMRAPLFPVAARVVATSPSGKKGLKISFEVRIPAASLALLPDAAGRRARLSAFVAVLDGGDVTTASPVTRDFTLPENAPDASAHITYAGEVVTTSPSPVISIGILDETSQEAGFERLEVGTPGTKPAS